MNCGLCKQSIRGDERYVTDHYKCSADLHQSFRDVEAEMLAALKGVFDVYGPLQGTLGGYIPHVRDAWKRVEAVIAKAEGR